MMFTRPQLRLLSIIAALFALAQANWLDVNVFHKRQGGPIESAVSGIISDLTGTGTGSSSPSSVGSDPVSSTPASTPATPTSGSSAISSTPASSTPQSSTPTPTSTSATSAPSTSTPDSTATSSRATSSDGSSSSASSSLSLSRSVHVATTVVLITTGGSTISSTMVSSSTSTSTATDPASLNGGSSSGSKGISTSTRNTIIGVCVGVGGAAIIGAIAFVIFRLRKSRKNQDESDGLMGYRTDVDSRQEKTSSTGGPNQFQSTLESYHAPQNANVSSNF